MQLIINFLIINKNVNHYNFYKSHEDKNTFVCLQDWV